MASIHSKNNMVIYFSDDNKINGGHRIVFAKEKFELGQIRSMVTFNGDVSATISYTTPCGVEEAAHIHGTKIEVSA
jgi:hypothetical protein